MAFKMTKRGSLDNETTNEFFCDTTDDLENIAKRDINLGSIAVVVDGMQVFIANSSKEWCSMTPLSDDNGSTSSN